MFSRHLKGVSMLKIAKKAIQKGTSGCQCVYKYSVQVCFLITKKRHRGLRMVTKRKPGLTRGVAWLTLNDFMDLN